MAELLPTAELADRLATLDGWSGDGRAISRTVELRSFPAAIEVVNRVANLAESMDHHPDIDIRWRTVTFTCATHTAGGVTEKDIDLARRINEILTSAAE
jgi:4a-hydroxytetrahydrobiopterin dehydratase